MSQYSLPPSTLPASPSAPPLESGFKIEIESDTLVLFIVTLLTFLVIDMLFIYAVTGPMFKREVQQIQGSPLTLRYAPALLMYTIMAFALFYFIIYPKKTDLTKLDSTDYISAFILGLAIFSAFDLTNLAIFEKYSAFTAVADIAWGSVLFMITVYGVSVAQRYLLRD